MQFLESPVDKFDDWFCRFFVVIAPEDLPFPNVWKEEDKFPSHTFSSRTLDLEEVFLLPLKNSHPVPALYSIRIRISGVLGFGCLLMFFSKQHRGTLLLLGLLPPRPRDFERDRDDPLEGIFLQKRTLRMKRPGLSEVGTPFHSPARRRPPVTPWGPPAMGLLPGMGILPLGTSPIHMLGRPTNIHETRFSFGNVRLANNRALEVTGMGDMVLKTLVDFWTLKDVRVVPALKKSLISVNQLDEQGHEVKFGNWQWKAVKGNLVMACERKSGSLYTVELPFE
ncbi:unnamed protein product [Cuscuta campestris]|uniref:Retrovirus-related Pol polyprotein from transposon TNT 1-94-like beta-barrel domain-containing protein n=1 Tax=Cuscuta campestris TaxID=132261 RepID=A0A484MAX2_9ASTE|nr:unnamed protein product [Cuscuta campestris]